MLFKILVYTRKHMFVLCDTDQQDNHNEDTEHGQDQ